jgi:putative FmdB family regulatory protein
MEPAQTAQEAETVQSHKDQHPMPTYQYQCEACDHAFEKYQSITAEALTTCPACGRESLEKLISGGTGYFVKDSGVLPDAKPKPKNRPPKEDETRNDRDEHHHVHHHHH